VPERRERRAAAGAPAKPRELVCVYAVVSGATGPLRADGASGERLRRVRVAGLDLVIGVMPRLPKPTDAALRRYDAAVRRLMQTHGSVLPARYGTCAATLEDLAAATLDRRQTLRGALRRVRHRVQMTVRVFAAGSRVRGELRVDTAPPRGVGPDRGRQYLQRRAAELQIAGAEPLRTAVKAWVRDERVERHDRGRLAGSMYHLIPRGAAAPYRDALQRAATAAGVTIVISGPWPPYALAEGGW
jgi:hypothetical protein